MDQALEQWLSKISAQQGRRVAVFDADGTLWRADSGDAFFQYQRERGLFLNAPAQGDALLKIYEDKVAQGLTREAFGDMALWNAGAHEHELAAWARDFWTHHGRQACPWIEPQMALVERLHRAGVEVWVVSASLWWVVAEGVKDLGISSDRVLAARTAPAAGGRGPLTDQWLYPLPYREDKVSVIEQNLGISPHLVSGNSMGDWHMMTMAQDMVVVINTARPTDPYYATEQELHALAHPRAQASDRPRWLIHKHHR